MSEEGDDPTFAVEGTARVKYPCLAGETATAKANVRFDVSDVEFGANATVTYFCKAPLDEPRFSVELETAEPVHIKQATVKEVYVYVEAYYKVGGGAS